MIAEWLPNLLLSWSVQATGVASPGPGVALVLGIATSQGRSPAMLACLGIGLAAVLMAAATVMGLAPIWAEFAWVATALKLLGAAFLAWLAYSAFRRSLSPPPPPRATTPRKAGSNISHGFLMQLINPKAMVFWLAVAALGGLGTAPLLVVLIFLVGAFVISFAGHGAWAFALSSAPFRALYARGRRWVEGALGAFFAFAAFKLATTRV